MRTFDIPTAISEVEEHTLSQLAEGKKVLEVGSLLGYSTVTMAQVAAQVVSVDPHEGYPADNPRPTWAKFNANLVAHEVEDFVVAYKANDDFLLNDELGRDFDLVFIDADGTYDTTIRIMERAEPLVTLDTGLLVVHDYGLYAWPGAGEAVRDFCTQRACNFGIVDTLAIIRPPHPDD